MSAPSRRAVLRAFGWAGAGLVVVAGAGCGGLVPALPHRRDPTDADAAAWLRLTPQGRIELVSPRAEMGQGISVALRQIVAEETGFPLERVVALSPRTDRLPPARATVGSESIAVFGPPVAAAAAALAATLAEAALAARGPAALLRVGEAAPRLAFDPIAAALLAARGGPDVFARWSRLDRYVHVRHPLRIVEIGPDQAVVEHRGTPGARPSTAMNYVLAGILAALLAAAGCGAVSVAMGREATAVIVDGRVADPLAPPSDTGLWRYAWRSGGAESSLVPRLHTALPLVRRIVELFEADPLRVWSAAEAAAAVGLSTRTLQRRLADQGVGLVELRRAAQTRRASALLLGGAASLAAVGYACGFSDAAHFTRAFRAATAMTPSAFRRHFAADPHEGRAPMVDATKAR